jgi:ferredoxin
MPTKTTIEIDRDACIGCGQCANACPQSVIEMRGGKAEVVRELQCDGLGVCIGECPVDAIRFIGREVPGEDAAPAPHPAPGGCPSLLNRVFDAPAESEAGETAPAAPTEAAPPARSALGHWPVQLHLVRPDAPQYRGRDVLIAATCTAFAMGGFHGELLQGRSLIIACPKLDRQEGYRGKLAELYRSASPGSVTVARMEVPCCRGLTALVAGAQSDAGSAIPTEEVVLSLDGEIRERRDLQGVG